MVPLAEPAGETIAASDLARVSSPAQIWVVAGAPGAGKSTVADLLLAGLQEAGRPVPALLDKDTLYGDFVAALLESAERSPGQREGDWYDAHIKRHEYAGMTAAAREISSRGCPVLLCAPFTQQIRNDDLWRHWLAELGGGPVRLVYVRSDAVTLAARLAGRSSQRDEGKRADFDAFVARMRPDISPPVPHAEIDNRREAPPLLEQIRELLRPDVSREAAHTS